MNQRSRVVACTRTRVATTIATSILLGTFSSALQTHRSGGAQSAPPTGPTPSAPVEVRLGPQNKLHFPYGVQTFEKREGLRTGSSVGDIPGWQLIPGANMVAATVVENTGISQPGQSGKRYLAVQDYGASASEGFITPVLAAPAPWNYAWTFKLKIVTAPASDVDAPELGIQHTSHGSYLDTWGVRLESTGAQLYVESHWGPPAVVPLFSYTGDTDIGAWITVRVEANLAKNTLRAFVNGTEAAMVRTRPASWTDVTQLRMSYHGNGPGSASSILLDEVGVAFLNPLCQDDVLIDFTTDDDGDPLANGQAIDVGSEFGEELDITGAGPNVGPVIFDTSNPGPNNPGQDLDLLVNQGNALILQNDSPNNPPPVGDFYPRPNDDEDGGVLTFTFPRWVQALSIDLIDMDDGPGDGASVELTDFSGLTRTYTVPTNWTGDVSQFEPGVGTLDLQTSSAQAGFGSSATMVEDAGYDPNSTVSMTVEFFGSGAVDNLHMIVPCVQITFDTEDDFTPIFTGTPLVNGQDLSTPPEFGVEMALSSAGPNAGAAIFDSTPGGPNDPGPDNDLLVGLGNICCLQNNLAATQTNPGIFDTPNDDTNGGDLFYDFPGPVHCHQLDLIDVDEEEVTGVTVTLLDSSGDTRVFTVPPGWTEDLLNDGPPGFRTLDLDTLAPQPGFMAVATAVEDPLFDPDDVVQMTVTFGGAQDMDNFCFCP